MNKLTSCCKFKKANLNGLRLSPDLVLLDSCEWPQPPEDTSIPDSIDRETESYGGVDAGTVRLVAHSYHLLDFQAPSYIGLVAELFG